MSYKRETTEEKIVKFLFKGILFLVLLPFKLIAKLFKKNQNLKKTDHVYLNWDHVDSKLAEIDQLMQLGKPSNYARAILEADNLLDYCLKGMHVSGQTMGERLKNARNLMDYQSYESAWQGHKVRNELAHNSQFVATDFIAKSAVGNLTKAIESLRK